jgi:MFS family permease
MSPAAPRRHALPALLVVGLGASIAPLDFAVNIAFPAITDAFSLPTASIRWVAVCYVLTYGSLMLGFGALGDRVGHLRVFRAGLALAAAAFALCALAPSFAWLLAARALQGVAVALTLSCAPALATLLFDESRRTWALSAYAGTAALAGVVAPIAGGALIALMGWPGVYWFRVPIALLALACVPMLRRGAAPGPTPGPVAPAAPAAPASQASQAFDAAGSALLAVSVGLLLLGPSLLRPDAGAVPAVPVTLAGALLMAVFVRRQRTATSPFLPSAVVRDADFWSINAGACVIQCTSFAVPLIVPYYLLRGGGWDPVSSGALLSVWACGTLLGSGIAPRIVARLGGHAGALAGAAFAAGGLAGIAGWPQAPEAGVMVAWLLLQGTGLGLFQVAYADVVVATLPVSARGVAGSLTMVTRTIGLVIGASGWIALLQGSEAAALASGDTPREAFVAGFGTVYIAAAAVTAAFFTVEALRRRIAARAARRGSR